MSETQTPPEGEESPVGALLRQMDKSEIERWINNLAHEMVLLFDRRVMIEAASRALVDAVLVDEGGLPGQQGHGGLLSRDTIAKAHAVQRILNGGGA